MPSSIAGSVLELGERVPTTLTAYRIAAWVVAPLAGALLRYRLRRGKEDRERLGERFGRTSRARPEGPLVWIHVASVGELNAVLPVIERIRAQHFAILCTSGTVTSARLAQERLPAGAIHQFVPLDAPRFVRRFLDHWRPDLALFVEADLWPNLIGGCARREVPILLLNGRMSARSYERWRRFPGTVRALLSHFELCLAQSPAHAERLHDLGAPRIQTTGNLKLDVPQVPADPVKLAELQGATLGRVVVAAASTHPGEDEIVIGAHRRLQSILPQLLTVIAPRHPERGETVAAAARAAGLEVAMRSRGEAPIARTEVYVFDTLGELGVLYRSAKVVCMGGSLVRHGGQNPIEPVKLGAAVLHGPHVGNFAEIYAALDAAGGARQVTGEDDLAAGVAEWIENSEERQRAAAAAEAAMRRLAGALDRTLAALEPYLLRLRLREQRPHA